MQVLLLNSSFEPIKIISWQKAIILLFKNKVEIVEEYDKYFIHSEKLTFRMPAVVKLHYFLNIRKYQSLRFSKENVFFRDNYTCVYCNKKFLKNYLTLDHVIPFSKGGKKTWYNIVTACHECNNKKGDRHLEQTDLKLLKKPIKPSGHNYLNFYIKFQNIPDKWRDYLPA
ncbi:MAG: HNH endonuclease [Spirochaetota bacterium]|nr:HNH endonuclease [Spirochaetota bacterium]